MKTVSFYNKGILDATSIATFGINAKDNDNAIGFFGTGLKYAIAVILREECNLIIYAGNDTYSFDVVETTVRDKVFKVVHMNGMPLGFTTELGKKWEMWQAFRELYCNALDEDGSVQEGEVSLCHEHAGSTVVTVSGQKFYDVYTQRDSIVLESKPHTEHGAVDIHMGASRFVYYKGVRIYDGYPKSMFTYNVKAVIDITEDRTARYEHQLRYKIATAIIQSTDIPMIKAIICPERDTFEHRMLDISDGSGQPSTEFLDTAEELRLSPKLNVTVLKVLAKHKRLPEPERIVLTDVQTVMLERAVKFCSDIGYPVTAYPIVVSADLRGGMLGLAKDGIIYIAQDTFGHGTKYLAATIIEEYLHLHTGHGDETRALQNYLFNEIVSLGERFLGAPV